ncbi:MAG TPA: glycosyltransferase family 1 protein [Polyangia bacterium]|nr:glycosyltransferase family 1 protein [Polyangia bacterium]
MNATSTLRHGSADLRVAVLHNYGDERQPSMRLYAERLGDALLRQGISVTRLRPPAIVPEAWRTRSATWAKLDIQFGRFAVYPRLVRNLDADVIHVIDHGQAYLLNSLDPARTVVTCHDVILLALAHGRIGSLPVPPIALQILNLSLELMKRAAAIVAVSEQTKRDLMSFIGLPAHRITVIAPGLNQPFAPDPERGLATRRRLNLGDGPLVLHIGRTFYKNIPGVLRVIHALRAQGIPARFVRTGRPLAGAERQLAERLGVVNHVVELRGVPDEQLPALYNAVDLLLFPSLYEGFGWPPLEAMASGTPVVCSRAGSLGDVVGDAALTADPEDTAALTWHAASILTDPALRRALIARGLAHVEQFSWARTAEQLIAVYRGITGKAA